MKSSPQRKAAVRRSATTSARLQDRQRKQRRNFFLERLEDRSLMATLYWQGGNGTDVSNPLNWVGNVAPQQDDSLVFPAEAAAGNRTANFNPAAPTRYRSITISGEAANPYTLSGSLGAGNSITLLEGVTFNTASGGSATVSVPLTLGAAASVTSVNVNATLNISGEVDLGSSQTLTTDGKGNINVTGIVRGTGASGITKMGDGVLTLGGANTFEGEVRVNQGVVTVAHPLGLGLSASAGTFVGTGAQVRLAANAATMTVAENFVIRDVGVGFDQATMGSIRSVTGTNILTGVITLGANASFGVDSASELRIGANAAIANSPTGATQSGTTVTITTTAAHGYVVGQLVTIAGVEVAGYNGTFAITGVPNSTSFTYTAA